VLGVVVLISVYRLRERPALKYLGVIFVGMAVWVNSHGSFVIGLVMVGIWLAERLWLAFNNREGGFKWMAGKDLRWAAAGSLAALAAVLINPRGLSVLDYILGMFSSPVIQQLVPEWAPPQLGSLGGSLFFASLVITSVVLIFSSERPGLFQIFSIVFFAGLGLKTYRGSPWFGIVAAPILAGHLALIKNRFSRRLPKEPLRAAPYLNLSLAAGLVILGFASLPWWKDRIPLPEQKTGLVSLETPIEAVNFLLDQQYPGQLYHYLPYGSYLIWAAQPDYPVFVDTRLELYPLSHWIDYLSIWNAEPNWEKKLDSYEVRTLLLSKIDQEKLVEAVEQSSRWMKVYEDQRAVIFRIND
jgi:hypothetical protein